MTTHNAIGSATAAGRKWTDAVPHDHPADGLDRDTTIAQIKAALKRRSSQRWSVTGGRGTDYGWIQIQATSRNHAQTLSEATELARLLDLTLGMCRQYASVPASSDYRREYVDRAEGRTPCTTGQQYWD